MDKPQSNLRVDFKLYKDGKGKSHQEWLHESQFPPLSNWVCGDTIAEGEKNQEENIKHNGEEIPEELWYLKLGRKERGDRKGQKATAKSLEEKRRNNFFKKARRSFQSKD